MEKELVAWEGKFLRIKICGRWEYAERPNALAGVVIVALTPDGELLLTEQYRVPMGRRVIELPAGLSGDEQYSGEPFIDAAKRELLEETGYEAAIWEELAAGPPSAGLSNEVVVFFLARQLRKVHEGGGEDKEQITVHRVPLKEVRTWLEARQKEGLLVDPKIFAGLYFLME